MLNTPKGLRMHIGLFGRRNVGKSSVLNAITNQETSIVSNVAGTTTDPIDKAMELLPLGPVLFVDTAGVDDDQEAIGKLRTRKTAQVLGRCDMALVVTEAGIWSSYETELCEQLKSRGITVLLVFNKMDAFEGKTLEECSQEVPNEYRTLPAVGMCAIQSNGAKSGVFALREAIIEHAPDEFIEDLAIVGDIVEPGSTVMLVVPIDKEAPKGRLILPQVQVIRDLLDSGSHAYVVQVEELASALANLKNPPALVITDSQAFAEVSKIVPEDIPLTGFSVLFSRFKGDLVTQVQGIKTLSRLTETSKVLIAEACTHHPIEEDIGTVKIPALLRKSIGKNLSIDNVRGVTFPENLAEYDLVIHCGGCMFNRRRMLSRIHACVAAGVPVTNYGLVLAYYNGVFERSIQVFQSSLNG